MISVSGLLKKVQAEFSCKKTIFYKRKSELESLGYELEPQRKGRASFYSDEQLVIISNYLSYINEGGIPEEYPTFEPNNIVKVEDNNIQTLTEDNNIQTHGDEIKTSPQENKARRLNEKIQIEAAKQEVMVDYYRTTGNYNIPGLAADVENAKEKIHQVKMARELESIANLIPD